MDIDNLKNGMSADELINGLLPSACRQPEGWAPVLLYPNGGRVISTQRVGTISEAYREANQMIAWLRENPQTAFPHPAINTAIECRFAPVS